MRVHGAQTIALAPLSDSETAALITELLGADTSVRALGQTIADRAAGNPFFAEEIVRDLAERGVLEGQSGAYKSTAEAAEVNVPATLQLRTHDADDFPEPPAHAIADNRSAHAPRGDQTDPGFTLRLDFQNTQDDQLAVKRGARSLEARKLARAREP